ncbi:DEAD/DEAH box helicase [Luteipulveratus sp. YIM 133132]|uniref:DEAD/DEAH box helicase n=1 Tax=Luteipulveratus flavus TaxID=3031728 RepID=A0ABT6C4C1_9MICO|nr:MULTISPECIES: DEAD/DEAH box helicase [unclassified Luteipulveratus]MDE9364213.1 DEAD/DEAH box helicase [Luteipulveratus sp. YIM 133132]MDF8263625.1 DEAD/DEAH box helicase [Luteipulveratus sp. YIM 133296]
MCIGAILLSSNAFARLGVPASLCSALTERGIDEPTPIQAATLPDSLAGRDVLGRGRTGSGKTYAFLLPVVTRLTSSGRRAQPSRPRSLILAPTRELATQIAEALAPLAAAAGLSTLTVFGGVGQNPQVRGLRAGVDILIACPGRLLDLMGQGACQLDQVEITVLDEADHMADLGFLPGVKRILDATPKRTQRLLFSATLDAGVDVIVKRYLSNPVTHETDSAQSPVSTMEHHVFHVSVDHRLAVLTDLAAAPGRTVVFTRTKHGAKKLAKQLNAQSVPAVELHGNLGQGARQRNLEAFHSGRATVLVATDIAARGIHVDDVALVVHADPPVEHKAYLHRAGRTARAGADGTVITLMLDDQVKDVRALTRAAGIKPRTTRVDPQHPVLTEVAPGERTYIGALVLTAPGQQSGSRPAGQPRSGGRGQGGRGQGGRGGQAGRGEGARGQGERGRGRGRGGRGAAGGSGQQTTTRTSGSGSGSGGQRTSSGGGGGRATVYSTSSNGSAAAFSARSSAGRRSR